MRKFSEAECEAFIMCKRGMGLLESSIDAKTSVDVMGSVVPGMRVFRRLESEGFLFFTEEDPIDIDGEPFQFTPSVELTDLGEVACDFISRSIYQMDLDIQTPDPSV